MNANSSKIKSAFQDDPEVLKAIEAREQRDLVQSLLEQKETPGADVILKSLQTLFKGTDAETPVKGEDYFTEAEIAQFKQEVTPEKFKDYFTETELSSIMTALLGAITEQVQGLKEEVTPKKGRDYRDGIDGDDGATPSKQELLALINPLIPKVKNGLDAKAPTVDQIIEKILSLEGDEATRFGKAMGAKIDISQIRNAQSFMMKGSKSKYKMEEMMHGSGSGSGSTANILTQYSLVATQDGNDALVALSQLTNYATLVGVIVAYHNQIPQTQGVTCNITATEVRFFNSDANDVFSITYTYA